MSPAAAPRSIVRPELNADADRRVVIASAGGASRHPAWYHNLVANSKVHIEVDGASFDARAATAAEPERTRLFDQQVASMAFFES